MTANVRLQLQPLVCPRPGCGRPMQVLMNGGNLYVRCSADPPKCGLILPADSAIAWAVEQMNAQTSESEYMLLEQETE